MDPYAGIQKELTGQETDPELREQKALELSERLGLPLNLNRTEEDLKTLPSGRHRRALGFYSRRDELEGRPGVTINLPNLPTVRDVVKAVFHEGVWHKGIRLFCKTEQERDRLMDHLYDNSSEEIRGEIDALEAAMFEQAKDSLSRNERFLRDQAKPGERIYAGSPLAIALAHVGAAQRRERGEYRRDATEEFGARVQEEVEEQGYEKMRADKLSFWQRVVNFMEKAMSRILRGIKIKTPWKYTRKEYQAMGSLFESKLREQAPEGPLREAEQIVKRYDKERKAENERTRELDLIRKESVADRIEELFNRAVSGDLKGKPIEIGRLSEAGRKYLEKLSGVKLKENVRFMLNPSDLQHINRRHFGENENDGRNIPLTIEDIRSIAEIINNPDKVLFGKEKTGDKRNMFFFLKEAEDGSYNLLEVYANSWGNLTSKSFFKSKESVSQRAVSLENESSHLTSLTDGPTLSDVAKLPKFFEYPKSEGEEEKIFFRDGDMGLEEAITKMKADAAAANGADFKAKQDAMRAIGGNLSKLRQAMARQREYDITTVKSMTDLAKILMDAGLMVDDSKKVMKAILTVVKDAVGREDTSKQVERLMDIMVDNQLHMGANYFGKLLSVKGSRVDARGIEVQGELDPDGQKIVSVVNKAKTRTLNDIDNMMTEAINRMSSADQALADEAALEYAGLQIARQYVEEIRESKNEEKELRKSIDDYKAERKAEAEEAEKSIEQARMHKDAGHMTAQDFNLLAHDIEEEERARWAAFKQYAEATNDAIRQNKIERAESYRSLSEQLGGVLGESVERAKQWREAEKLRVEEIHHNANSDMKGRQAKLYKKEGTKDDILNIASDTLLSPLRTFEQMLKMFGSNSSRGEGYLYQRFMRQLMDALDNEWRGYSKSIAQLDEKVSQVFGEKMKWTDLYKIEKKLPKGKVKVWDDGKYVDIELKQGNLLYVYMVDKMTDGRMKLRRMGITEEAVERIKDFVDPRFIELADWIQEEFLVNKRNKYNEVYKRMFGTSMAAIENYFPIRVLKTALDNKPEEEKHRGQTTVSAETTGAWKKRTRNNKPLDIMNANVISLIVEHLKEMEHAHSFSELSRDLNTLRKYKKFEARVRNMRSIYGAGNKLWNHFEECCSMATGDYKPPTSEFDRASMGFAKWATAAKIAFRFFTAFKQFASFPAFLADCRLDDFAFTAFNLKGSWKWAMENLPNFEKRWKSRIAGDPILKRMENEHGGSWKAAKEWLGRWGMASNAFVDGLTVAIGARAMYKTKVRKYRRWGLPEEEVQKRAKQDAEILFNLSQQSSESAFLSTIQSSGTFWSAMWTVFRNASMSYSRQVYDACRNLVHRFKPSYKEQSIEFMRKQMIRSGVAENIAEAEARREYRTGWARDVARVAIYAYVLPAMWYLLMKMPFLLIGNDEEKKKDMVKDALVHGTFGTVEGFAGGDLISDGLNMLMNGEMNLNGLEKNMPIVEDIRSTFRRFKTDEIAALNDLINIGVQVGLGVNPQTLEDMVVAALDFAENGDWNDVREYTFLIARIMNCPQSQLDEIYFDEIGMSGEEIAEIPRDKIPEEIAERYAEYKLHRNAALTGWAYDDETRKAAMDKQRKKAKKTMKERMTSTAANQRTRELLEGFEEVSKKEKELNRLKKSDREAYRRGRKELFPDSIVRKKHNRIKLYNHDIKRLTKKWMNAKTPEGADSVAKVMVKARERMLQDIDSIEQLKATIKAQ
ncbi:MAG: hypothetical protein K2M69_05995 [Muribaculaceae bacterium]|nr:hypothetical protein [Muribaculaceae bacterium]